MKFSDKYFAVGATAADNEDESSAVVLTIGLIGQIFFLGEAGARKLADDILRNANYLWPASEHEDEEITRLQDLLRQRDKEIMLLREKLNMREATLELRTEEVDLWENKCGNLEKDVESLRAKVALLEGENPSPVGYPWDAPYNDVTTVVPLNAKWDAQAVLTCAVEAKLKEKNHD